MQERSEQSGSFGVVLAWIVVMIPLCWGVYNTALNVVKLFK
jgi:hypothetical protein